MISDYAFPAIDCRSSSFLLRNWSAFVHNTMSLPSGLVIQGGSRGTNLLVLFDMKFDIMLK